MAPNDTFGLDADIPFPGDPRDDVSDEVPPQSDQVPTGSDEVALLSDPQFLNLFIAKTPLVIAASDVGDEVMLEVPRGDGTILCRLGDPHVLDHVNNLARQYRPHDLTAFVGKRDLTRLADFCHAHAPHVGTRRPVFKRLAWLPDDGTGAIWLNLSRPDGAAIRLSASHWNMEPPPVSLFAYSRHQRPLPEPVSSEEGYEAFRRIVPSMDEADLKLLIGAMLGMMIPSGFMPSFSYPAIVFTGQAGSGKTFATRLVKMLIDNEHALTATRPQKAEDVWIQARYSHILTYDNMRTVWDGLSDTLCALTTNSAQKRRTLYSDNGLSVNAGHCPIILNGINPALAQQRDLIDRSITITLARFDTFDPHAGSTLKCDLPLALGFLCDLMVRALANLADTHVETTSRLALVATFAAAAEPFGIATPFHHLLIRNQRQALLNICEHHPVLDALYELMGTQPEWRGTYKDLLARLGLCSDTLVTTAPEWPRSPHKLSAYLKENDSLIRELNIEVVPGPKHNNGRIIDVRRLAGFTYQKYVA